MEGTGGLEVLREVRVGRNVEEDSAFSGEISWTGRFRIQVSCESFGLDMDRSDDTVMVSGANITILNEKIL